MSVKVDSAKTRRKNLDETAAAAAETKAKDKALKKPAGWAPAKTAGGPVLAAQAKKPLLPSLIYKIEQLPKPQRPPAPPSIEAPRRWKLIPASAEAGVPIEVRFEAGKRFEAAEAKHEKAKGVIEFGIKFWDEEARRHRAAGATGPAGEAERHVARLRSALVEEKREFDLVKNAFATLLGESREVGLRQGNADAGPVDPALKRTAAERFAAQLAQYNKRVETLKRSGVLIQPFVTGYALAVELRNGRIDEYDRKVMDLLYTAGALLERGVSTELDRASGPRGAGSIVPGVDYRNSVKDSRDAISWDARQPREIDR